MAPKVILMKSQYTFLAYELVIYFNLQMKLQQIRWSHPSAFINYSFGHINFINIDPRVALIYLILYMRSRSNIKVIFLIIIIRFRNFKIGT